MCYEWFFLFLLFLSDLYCNEGQGKGDACKRMCFHFLLLLLLLLQLHYIGRINVVLKVVRMIHLFALFLSEMFLRCYL